MFTKSLKCSQGSMSGSYCCKSAEKNKFWKFCIFQGCIIWHSKILIDFNFFLYLHPHFISRCTVIGTCCYFLGRNICFQIIWLTFPVISWLTMISHSVPKVPSTQKHSHSFHETRHECDCTVVDDIKQSSIWFTYLIQISYVCWNSFN